MPTSRPSRSDRFLPVLPVLPLSFALTLGACAPAEEVFDTDAARLLVDKRMYDSKVPDGYDPSKPTPLVVLLHGYGANGVVQDVYFGLSQIMHKRGFLLAYPDGLIDKQGKQFWNATDACCDFDGTRVDDVAYLDAIITDMSSRYNVDRKRVFFVGHSNGGFMSYRMACDKSRRIAAIASLAGANWSDAETKCQPDSPVAVLQVHGDKDAQVPYQGGTEGGRTIPSAEGSVAFWAKRNGCTAATEGAMMPPLDLDQTAEGAETLVKRWPGCQHAAAELWTMRGVGHVPNFVRPDWAEALWGFLSAHPKP